MITATLTRDASTDCGTFGTLSVLRNGAEFQCLTLELPWRENAHNVSCIPTGEYRCEFGASSRGRCYHVLNVPHRDGILVHAGNWAGDKLKCLRSDSEGCILVGKCTATMEGQRGIAQTRDALNALHEFTGMLPFQLIIKETSA